MEGSSEGNQFANMGGPSYSVPIAARRGVTSARARSELVAILGDTGSKLLFRKAREIDCRIAAHFRDARPKSDATTGSPQAIASHQRVGKRLGIGRGNINIAGLVEMV